MTLKHQKTRFYELSTTQDCTWPPRAGRAPPQRTARAPPRGNLSSRQFIKTRFLVFFAREQIGAPRRETLCDVVRLFVELKMYALVI